MKSKLFLATALVLAGSMSSFAASDKKQVPADVVSAFNSDFSASGKVTWVTGAGYYKAGFIESGVLCYAFYAATGELIGMGRQLTTDNIPVAIAKQLKADYSGYSLIELYEIGTEKTGDYLLVLNKGNEQIRLRSNEANELSIIRN